MNDKNKIGLAVLLMAGLSGGGVAYAQESGCNMFRYSNGKSMNNAQSIRQEDCTPISVILPSSEPDTSNTNPTPPAETFEEDVQYSFFDNVNTGYWYRASSSWPACYSNATADVTKYSTSACNGYLNDTQLAYPDNQYYNTMPLAWDANDRVDVTFHVAVPVNGHIFYRIGGIGVKSLSNGDFRVGLFDDTLSNQGNIVGLYVDDYAMNPQSQDASPIMEMQLENLHKFRVLYDNGVYSIWQDDVLAVDSYTGTSASARTSYGGVQLSLSDGGPIWVGPLSIQVQRRAN